MPGTIAKANLCAAKDAECSGPRERKIVALFCCLAAIHVLVFSAAAPPYNSMDEQRHLDLVVKYSHGCVPRDLAPLSSETAEYLATYESPEYSIPPDAFPGGTYPLPLWATPADQAASVLQERVAAWQKWRNHEVAQPPLYYALAGIWWKAGGALGLTGGLRLYWLRFLNVWLVAALVWLGYAVARKIFQDAFLRLAVPALLAFMPQTILCSINNDALTPLTFGAAFLCLILFCETDIPGIRLGAAAGLAFAAAYLTKATNVPPLAVWLLLAAWKVLRLAKSAKLRAALPALAVLSFCAAVPVIAWMAWCEIHFGDLTGSVMKARFLTWTLKPFPEWWHHPIFSLEGAWTFLSGLLATFWRGEYIWGLQQLYPPEIDLVYVLASLGFLITALAVLVRPSTNISGPQRRQSRRQAQRQGDQPQPVADLSGPQRQALWFALASCAASVAFLGFVSVIYDFNTCQYPSPRHPFFTSGRLMLGPLIPFLLLFAFGLGRALRPWGNLAKFYALAGIVLFMLISETVVDQPLFASNYNFFHIITCREQAAAGLPPPGPR